MTSKIINIGSSYEKVRLLHAKRSLAYFYENCIKDSDTLLSTVEAMHVKNVRQKEQLVLDNLKQLGFTKED